MFGKLKSLGDSKDPPLTKVAPNKEPPKEKSLVPVTQKKIKKQGEISSRIKSDLQGSFYPPMKMGFLKRKGSKFRLMNEFFYTNPSQKATNYFQAHSQDFDLYHKGFQKQIAKWPEKPIETIISLLEKDPKFHKKNLIDLGCGEGALATRLLPSGLFTEILSFDLVSLRPHITACDIRSLPLKSSSRDIAVFCLALMGTNYLEFLIEATRCLKLKGFLIISEVSSRITDKKAFEAMVCSLGYETSLRLENSSYFVVMVFLKVREVALSLDSRVWDIADLRSWAKDNKDKGVTRSMGLKEASQLILKPCVYKRR